MIDDPVNIAALCAEETAVLRLFNRIMAAASSGWHRRTHVGEAFAVGGDHPMLNGVLVVSPDPDADEVARGARFVAHETRRPAVAWIRADARLTQALCEAGLPILAELPSLALTRAPNALRKRAPTFHLRRATTAADIAAFWSVVSRCFDGAEYCGAELRQTFAASAPVLLSQATVLLLEVGGEVLAGGMAVRQGPVGGLFWISTIAEFRRRGAGTVVAAALVDRLRIEGVERTYLQASKIGLSVYERLGFECAFRRTVHIARR